MIDLKEFARLFWDTEDSYYKYRKYEARMRKEITQYNRILRHDNNAPLTSRIYGHSVNSLNDSQEVTVREVFQAISSLSREASE